MPTTLFGKYDCFTETVIIGCFTTLAKQYLFIWEQLTLVHRGETVAENGDSAKSWSFNEDF